MFGRERFEAVYARDRPWVLPQIEVVLPFFCGRECPVDDFDANWAARICSCLYFGRDIYFSHSIAGIFSAPFDEIERFFERGAIGMGQVFNGLDGSEFYANAVVSLYVFAIFGGFVRHSYRHSLSAPESYVEKSLRGRLGVFSRTPGAVHAYGCREKMDSGKKFHIRSSVLDFIGFLECYHKNAIVVK